MSFLKSIENNSKKFEDPFLHWELDKPLTDGQINEIVNADIANPIDHDLNYDGTRAIDGGAPEFRKGLSHGGKALKFRCFVTKENSTEFPHLMKLIKELQNRPRTITHGDARGNNIFKSRSDGTMGIIDWQMWVAGPASNEFGQVWFNSFSLESGMIHKLDELTSIYYQAMISKRPDIEKEYPYDLLLDDLKLLFINIWPEYLGFTVGSIDGYKDPEQAKSKENWREMMKRNMETLHYSGCIDSFERFISKLNLSDSSN